MIGATSQWSDDAFHLKREEQRCQLANRDIGFDTDDIELQVVGLLEQADDLLFLRRQVWKQLSFNNFRLLLNGFPPHAFYKVCC